MPDFEFFSESGDRDPHLVCADNQPAFRVTEPGCPDRFFGADGIEFSPTSWTPGECTNPFVFERSGCAEIILSGETFPVVVRDSVDPLTLETLDTVILTPDGSVVDLVSLGAILSTCTDCPCGELSLSPSLSVTKNIINQEDQPFGIGDTVRYQLFVVNTGQQTLNNVQLSDPDVTVEWDPQDLFGAGATLAGGGFAEARVNHVMTAADVSAGTFSNTAVATSPDLPDPIPSNPTSVPVQDNPLVSVTKITISQAPYSIGDLIEYAITIVNLGDTLLTGVTVADPIVDAIISDPDGLFGLGATLAPGDSAVATVSHTVTQSDLDNGVVVNIATVDSPDLDDPVPSDPVITPVLGEPAMTATKTVINGPGPFADGDVVLFQIGVLNTGDIPLTGVTVTDSLGTPISDPFDLFGAGTTLSPGGQATAVVSYTVTATDVAAGGVTNIASGDAIELPASITSPSVSVPTVGAGLLIIKNEVGSGPYSQGDAVTYSITVTNTGSVTLTAVTVSDPVADAIISDPDDLFGAGATLLSGGSAVATVSHVVTGTDLVAGQIANTASASTPDLVDPVSDTEVVPTPLLPSIEVTKTGSLLPPGPHQIGDLITYTFTVTNTGNSILDNVTVSDPLVTVVGGPISLPVGGSDSTTFTATYALTQVDLDAGLVQNQAVAFGEDPAGNPVSGISDDPTTLPLEDPTIIQIPCLDVEKVGVINGGQVVAVQTGGVFVPITIGDTIALDSGATVTLQPDGTLAYDWSPPPSIVENIVADDVPWTLAGISESGSTEMYDARSLTYSNLAGHVVSSLTFSINPIGTYDDSIALDLNGDGIIDYVITQGDAHTTVPTAPNPGAYTPWIDASPLLFTVTVTSSGTSVLATWNGTPLIPGSYAGGGNPAESAGFDNVAGFTLADLGFNPDGSIPTALFTTAEIRMGSLNDAGPSSHAISWNIQDAFTLFDPIVYEWLDSSGSIFSSAVVDPLNQTLPAIIVPQSGTAEAGDVIEYTFTVTNCGNETLTGITLSDPLVSVSGGPIALAAGMSDSTTFVGSYTLSQADIDAGLVENQATASGTDPGGTPIEGISDDPSTPSPNDPTVTPTENLSILLQKQADPPPGGGPAYALGETINYAFTVTNTSNVDLVNVTVTDPNAAVVGGPIPLLPAGSTDSTTFTAFHVVNAADVAAGTFANQATACGISPQGGFVCAPSDDPTTVGSNDPTVVDIASPPALSLTKTGVLFQGQPPGGNFDNEDLCRHFDNSTFAALFDGNTTQATTTGNLQDHRLHQDCLMTWDFVDPYTATDSFQIYWSNAQQSGNAPDEIIGLEILFSDDGGATTISFFTPTELVPSITGDQVFDVTPGITVNWMGIRSILSEDVGEDPYIWELSINNIDNSSFPPPPPVPGAGSLICYTFEIENTGGTVLTGVTVNDPLITVTGGPLTLNPGETGTLTGTYTVTAADELAGQVDNTATAFGNPPAGPPVTDIDSETVVIP